MPLFFYRLEVSTAFGQKKIVYKFKSEPPTRSFPCKGVGIGQTKIQIIPIKFFDVRVLFRFTINHHFGGVAPGPWVCGAAERVTAPVTPDATSSRHTRSSP